MLRLDAELPATGDDFVIPLSGSDLRIARSLEHRGHVAAAADDAAGPHPAVPDFARRRATVTSFDLAPTGLTALESARETANRVIADFLARRVRIDTRGGLSSDVGNVGNGAGTVASSTGLPSSPPVIKFRPGKPPERVT